MASQLGMGKSLTVFYSVANLKLKTTSTAFCTLRRDINSRSVFLSSTKRDSGNCFLFTYVYI